MGVNGEAFQLHAVYKSHIFYYKSRKSHENTYQVQQVTCAASECAMKSKVRYDKIIITILPSYTGKNITRLLPLAFLYVLRTCNNTDGNKLVIFSSIALYLASFPGSPRARTKDRRKGESLGEFITWETAPKNFFWMGKRDFRENLDQRKFPAIR